MQPADTVVLVVDDDPDIGSMLKLILEYRGYAAVVAQDEIGAKEYIQNGNISLIIMDMLLSGTNGTDLCRELKRSTEYHQLPIIMISAHPNARELCMDAGADDFLLKPFDMDQIIASMHNLLDPVS
jgi:DNA-binding response OmpR family regulator